MKQIFAIFLALCILPCFQTFAWIGGPFSNNSYFSENGDDGVYEAVGIPSTAGVNGIGIMRWAVTNSVAINPDNLTSTAFVTTTTVGGVTTTTTSFTISPTTSNVFLGGVNQITHAWFLQGVSYTGTCNGIVNSGLGIISCSGLATQGTTANTISAGFTATFDNSGNGIPIARFRGTGDGTAINGGVTTPFSFNAFGSKVSSQVIYNGV